MDMTYWCESCARKSNCYTIRNRPKCFVAITNSERIAEQDEPNSSEIPNNCKPQTDCLEQFRVGLEYHTDTTHFGKTKGESITTNKVEDEPQTNADQHTQHVESVETMSCQECKRWIYDDRWGWFCPLKSQDECKYEPKDEPNSSEKPNNCEDCEHWNDTEDGCADRHGCKDEPQTEYEKIVWHKDYGYIKDEPQTERKCVNCKFLTYRFGKTWCDIKCDNPHDKVCDRWTERSE